MNQSKICRHCKRPFTAQPGKHRYIDECPSCKPEPDDVPHVFIKPSRNRPIRRPDYEQPKIKKLITNLLLLQKPFQKCSRKNAFQRWKKAYKDGNPKAKKILDEVLELQKQEPSDF